MDCLGDGDGYPELFPALVLELPEQLMTSQEPGNLHPGSPTPRLAGCVCNSFPPAADKGSLQGNPAQVFITGIMPRSQRPREPGKTPSSNSKVKGLEEEQLGTGRLQQPAETFQKTEP